MLRPSIVLLVSCPLLACAAPVPARPFADHMVLPMRCGIPVWGAAEPHAVVEIRFGDHSASGKADAGGNWRVLLPPQEPSAEGRDMEIRSNSGNANLRDVLIGEVWLCAGQSNMDFPLARAVGGKAEVDLAGNLPAIRLLDLTGTHTAGRAYGKAELERLTPAGFFTGKWRPASAESAAGFSAVGWWAGKAIHQARKVPVGLIDCSVGGSGAEAWLPRETLESRGEYAELLDETWTTSPRVAAWTRGRAMTNLAGKAGNHPYRPGFLFDSGPRWWRGFPLTGVLWYQGETNAEILDDAWNGQLITDLVKGWRKVLERPSLPFFMVQLPRIGGNDPLRQGWPRFRAVQERAAGALDRVTLVKTMDLGWDSPDVHPPDKRPVGERLGKAVVISGGRR